MTLIEICIHLIRGVSAHSLSALVFFCFVLFFLFCFVFFGGGGVVCPSFQCCNIVLPFIDP